MILLTHERQWRGGETAVAFGMFDGVHEGHAQLMRKANELAALYDLKSVVYTFSSHPMATYAPDRVPPQLETRSEKIRSIAQLGIDAAVLRPFDRAYAAQSPEEFVQAFVSTLHPKHVVIGFNYSFGKMGAGKAADMRRFGEQYGFETHVVDEVQIGGLPVSSTRVRAAVAQGDVVDIAFTPQINEYRSVRSVQLNLVDIRPDKAFREAQGHDRAVYRKHLSGGELSCDEADSLLPARQDFVAVWRYLAAFSQDGTLCEELGCLSRKISRCAKLPLSAGKTRICLDVLAEQGLVQLEQRPKTLLIRLCADGRKVDLEKSPILIHLKKQKAGT